MRGIEGRISSKWGLETTRAGRKSASESRQHLDRKFIYET